MAEPSGVAPSAIIVIESAETFTEFKKLPIELRLNIWKLAIPKDRVVAIVDRRLRKVSFNGDFEGFNAMLSARYTVPAVMQVCRESRSEVKKSYTYILKEQLGLAVPFNFKHDTLLMDGPDGLASMWSFEKTGRKTARSREELLMIHANLKHLAVHGQRLNSRALNEVQQYTGLETLVLPANPYWNSRQGHDAFNLRISQRLRATWTSWQEKGYIKQVKLVSREDDPPFERPRFRPFSFLGDSLGPVGNHTLYLVPIDGDLRDYSRASLLPAIDFLKEDQLNDRLAASTQVTLSYIDHPRHPAALAALKGVSPSEIGSNVNTPQSSFSSTFDDMVAMTRSRAPVPIGGMAHERVSTAEFQRRARAFIDRFSTSPSVNQMFSLMAVDSPLARSLVDMPPAPKRTPTATLSRKKK